MYNIIYRHSTGGIQYVVSAYSFETVYTKRDYLFYYNMGTYYNGNKLRGLFYAEACAFSLKLLLNVCPPKLVTAPTPNNALLMINRFLIYLYYIFTIRYINMYFNL